MNNHPKSVEMTCIYGRDGATWDGSGQSWWKKHVEMDNDKCSILTEDIEKKAALWAELSDEIEMEEMTPLTVDEMTRSRNSIRSMPRAVWSSAMLMIMAMMGLVIGVWEWKTRRESKHKSIDDSHSEAAPLMHSVPQYH